MHAREGARCTCDRRSNSRHREADLWLCESAWEKLTNPADSVDAASIATFVPKDRALSPLEIRLMARQLESVATYPTTRLALRMILLTMVRKSELIQSTG